MTREVVLTETAQQQMNAAADWYAEQNPAVAAKWFNGLIHRLNALSDNPEQYSVARESEFLLLSCDRCCMDRANASPTAFYS